MLRALEQVIAVFFALSWASCSAQFNVPSRLTTKYFLFSANNAGNSVSSYSVDSTTGKLTSLSSKSVGTAPNSLAIESGRHNVYVANTGDNTITALNFNTTSGVMTELQTVSTSSGLFAIVMHPDGQHLFASVANSPNFQTMVYSLDSTGLLKLTQTVATKSGFMAVNSTGTRLYSSSGFVYSIDSGSNLSLLQDASNADCTQSVGEIAIHPSNTFLYMPCNNTGFKVFKIQASDGSLGVSNVYNLSAYAISAVATTDGTFVIVTSSGAINAYRVGSQVDNHTLINPVMFFTGSYSLAVMTGLSFLFFGEISTSKVKAFPLSDTNGYTITGANSVAGGSSPQNIKIAAVSVSTKL